MPIRLGELKKMARPSRSNFLAALRRVLDGAGDTLYTTIELADKLQVDITMLRRGDTKHAMPGYSMVAAVSGNRTRLWGSRKAVKTAMRELAE